MTTGQSTLNYVNQPLTTPENCDNMVNYNIAYSKMTYKYLSEAFYNKINKQNTNHKSGRIIYTGPI